MSDKTCITVAVGARNTLEARRLWDECAADADIIELRLDLMEEYNLPELLCDRPTPVIVTNRPVREGGRYEGDEVERVKVLLEASELGAEHIDCEADSYQIIRGLDLGETKVILSRHNFNGMYSDMQHVYEGIRNKGGDIAKLVCTAAKITDCVSAINVLRNATTPVVSITMGSMGAISRILAGKYGAYLTFAAPRNIEGTAPGQLTLDVMKNFYRTNDINRQTLVYGYAFEGEIPEKKIGVLNNGIRASGKNAVIVPLPLGDEEPEKVINAFRELSFDGYAIDTGESGRVAEECDDLDASVDKEGSVNAVTICDGRLKGFALPDLDAETLTDLWTE